MESATLLVLLLLASPAGAAEPGPSVSQIVRVETTFGPVYVSSAAPAGHYAERHHGEVYWLPGIDEGTSLVRKVIRNARLHRERGEAVELRSFEAGSRRVYVTEEPPFPGVFWLRVGDLHAWIPGVEKPLEADMAALEQTAAALEAVAPEPPAVAAAAAP